jgi:hypothetical protein
MWLSPFGAGPAVVFDGQTDVMQIVADCGVARSERFRQRTHQLPNGRDQGGGRSPTGFTSRFIPGSESEPEPAEYFTITPSSLVDMQPSVGEYHRV